MHWKALQACVAQERPTWSSWSNWGASEDRLPGGAPTTWDRQDKAQQEEATPQGPWYGAPLQGSSSSRVEEEIPAVDLLGILPSSLPAELDLLGDMPGTLPATPFLLPEQPDKEPYGSLTPSGQLDGSLSHPEPSQAPPGKPDGSLPLPEPSQALTGKPDGSLPPPEPSQAPRGKPDGSIPPPQPAMAPPALNPDIIVPGCKAKSPSVPAGCTAKSPSKATPPWRNLAPTSSKATSPCFRPCPTAADLEQTHTELEAGATGLEAQGQALGSAWALRVRLGPIEETKTKTRPRSEGLLTWRKMVAGQTHADACLHAPDASGSHADACLHAPVAPGSHADEEELAGEVSSQVQDLLLLDVTPLSMGLGHSRSIVAVGYLGKGGKATWPQNACCGATEKPWRYACFNCHKRGHLAAECNLSPTWPPTKKAQGLEW